MFGILERLLPNDDVNALREPSQEELRNAPFRIEREGDEKWLIGADGRRHGPYEFCRPLVADGEMVVHCQYGREFWAYVKGEMIGTAKACLEVRFLCGTTLVRRNGNQLQIGEETFGPFTGSASIYHLEQINALVIRGIDKIPGGGLKIRVHRWVHFLDTGLTFQMGVRVEGRCTHPVIAFWSKDNHESLPTWEEEFHRSIDGRVWDRAKERLEIGRKGADVPRPVYALWWGEHDFQKPWSFEAWEWAMKQECDESLRQQVNSYY